MKDPGAVNMEDIYKLLERITEALERIADVLDKEEPEPF